ncbi:diaminopimelate epimerase [Lampropedia puyangensis]|uniref:Diaminopimelate epimerase n=1 Tax=Lampropedia puyangensis TaxID=1330072 RepID=A0A4S8FB85_9BURK|nr:diaminopimelate epimerase [Lampropedia puyangensis]THU04095.1 diaminopimelate epimerase [Lampropedia puyangensis]
MKIPFTKMQGAGNDFVVLDETRNHWNLSAAQYRWLADRHFGVGADQILTVRPAPAALADSVDFEYVIHNADGGEVEQCGNGARCFARYVFDKQLTNKHAIRVSTRAGIIAPQLQSDGRVTVNMGQPRWAHEQVPFTPEGLKHDVLGQVQRWWLPLPAEAGSDGAWVVAVSMGNPHAVQVVDSAAQAPVGQMGPWIEHHASFPQRVNAGFMEVQSRTSIALRVYERGAGETLACGTGACAAVVSGIAMGLLDSRVNVHTRGGVLTIEWAGAQAPVMMTGPAQTVFEGFIEIPETL